MRINTRVLTEKTDLLGGIQIQNCPSQFRSVAERLIMLVTKPGYSVTDYQNVTQLDKILTLHFWQEYDGLDKALMDNNFCHWYLKEATSVDLITRALRWLTSHNYLLLKPEVIKRAMQASDRWRQSVATPS